LTDAVSINTKFHSATILPSSEMQFMPSLSCNAAQWKLVVG